MAPRIEVGDLVHADESVQPADGDLVMAETPFWDPTLVRELRIESRKLRLVPANPGFLTLDSSKHRLTVLGKVTRIEHPEAPGTYKDRDGNPLEPGMLYTAEPIQSEVTP